MNSKEQKNNALTRNDLKEDLNRSEKKVKPARRSSTTSVSIADCQILQTMGQQAFDVERTSIVAALMPEDTDTERYAEIDNTIISAYIEMLKDKSISSEQRMSIIKGIERRRDRMDRKSAESEKERTRRLKLILWQSTFQVLGIAVLFVLPDILKTILDHYPINKV